MAVSFSLGGANAAEMRQLALTSADYFGGGSIVWAVGSTSQVVRVGVVGRIGFLTGVAVGEISGSGAQLNISFPYTLTAQSVEDDTLIYNGGAWRSASVYLLSTGIIISRADASNFSTADAATIVRLPTMAFPIE